LHFIYSFALIFLLTLPDAALAEESWIQVDTGDQTLDLYEGRRRVLHFEGISIGRNGVTRDKLLGDKRTPLGQYKVAWLNPKSRFRYFIGLDYPRREQVERAYQRGVIKASERDRLLKAWYLSTGTPQNSPLGGQIGIHGLGSGNARLHEIANWTEGCVALTNRQIDQLRSHVRIGMRVIIRD